MAVAGSGMDGKDGPKPGEGPSREERENGFYDVVFLGVGAKGERMLASVKGDRDPGYGSTSKMIAESALALIEDATATPGGVWTTAPALGIGFVQRLQRNAGLTFAIESASGG